jgi:hypothetical protein
VILVEYTLINLITFGIGVVFLYNGYRIVRSGREDLMVFVMSSIVGSGLLIVAVYPDLFTVVASVLGIEFKTNAILIVSNLTLFVLVTYLFNRIGRLYDNVSRLNEELSLYRSAVDEDSQQHDD